MQNLWRKQEIWIAVDAPIVVLPAWSGWRFIRYFDRWMDMAHHDYMHLSEGMPLDSIFINYSAAFLYFLSLNLLSQLWVLNSSTGFNYTSISMLIYLSLLSHWQQSFSTQILSELKKPSAKIVLELNCEAKCFAYKPDLISIISSRLLVCVNFYLHFKSFLFHLQSCCSWTTGEETGSSCWIIVEEEAIVIHDD